MVNELWNAEQEIKNSSALKAHRRIHSLMFHYRVFEGNYSQLSTLLVNLQKPEVAIIWGAEANKAEFDVVQIEVARNFQNYIVSAKSLSHHVNNLVNRWYDAHPFKVEYTQKVKEIFVSAPIAGFIEELRNFTLHDYLPLSHANFHLVREETDNEFTMTVKFLLDKSQFEIYKKWPGKAEAYLAKSEDDLELAVIASEYFQLTRNFHQWVNTRLREIHTDELNWLEEKFKALALLQMPYI